MSLYQLLYAISQGSPINLDSLYRVMPSGIHPKDIFGDYEMVAKNKYKVSIVDQQKFMDLLTQSKAPTTRTEAAGHTLQSSHYLGCDSAYMLCFPLMPDLLSANGLTENHPASVENFRKDHQASLPRHLLSVASVRAQELPMLFKPTKHAILIENQDCFFDWQRLMPHFGSTVNMDECDIYFAGGKRILNPAFASFLKQYDNLYCAFDYDLDGLKMARGLMLKRYANTHVLVPDKLSLLEALFTFKPSSTARFLESLTICKDMNLLDLHETMSSTQHFMEQEALLGVPKPS